MAHSNPAEVLKTPEYVELSGPPGIRLRFSKGDFDIMAKELFLKGKAPLGKNEQVAVDFFIRDEKFFFVCITPNYVCECFLTEEQMASLLSQS